jgi:hypothetical protein
MSTLNIDSRLNSPISSLLQATVALAELEGMQPPDAAKEDALDFSHAGILGRALSPISETLKRAGAFILETSCQKCC